MRLRKRFPAACLWLVSALAPHAADTRITIDAARAGHRISPYLAGSCIEDVNHEVYGGIDSQMIFGESFAEPAAPDREGVSGPWRAIRTGTVEGGISLDPDRPFSGHQSQHIRYVSGEGAIGIENQGLNRQGMNFVANQPYQGKLWVRAAKGTGFLTALESRDGKTTYASQSHTTTSGDWQSFEFTLTPKAADTRGRFSIRLEKPGAISIGYAFLQPGEWGRFKGLPVRKDVAEGLIAQGVTIMRYGGCMANAPEYRWKNMIGPREKRPPYKGWWYPQSSNGWGIFDFLNFCEAAGFLAIPDVNMDESPQDMADFIEYVNGPADSKWGARRAADGHPAPYQLKHLQLGNEEKVNADYWRKFKPLAEAIWAKDKDIILVIGDFAYQKPVTDPSRVEGADSKITTLDAQREILQLAKQHGREVWFDLHIWTEGPLPSSYLEGTLSYLDTMEKLADGARFKVVVFELNANNHDQRRALANAIAIQRLERDGRVPVVVSANALQPDGQNDNGWDQGLLFLNPEKTWLQPPGYVTRMISSHYQPVSLPVETDGGSRTLDICAKRSDDGKTLVVQIVNPGDTGETASLQLRNFPLQQPAAAIEQLTGPLHAANTAQHPDAITPKRSTWKHGGGTHPYTFPPRSFTVMTFR